MNPQQHKFVCANCFNDDGLASLIRHHAVSKSCSFCHSKSKSPIAAPFELVFERINNVVWRYFDDPANVLPYESAEGGYQGNTYDTDEVFESLELDFPRDKQEVLRKLIHQKLGNDFWCDAEPFRLSEFERLEFSWRGFCEIVKHQFRYFFSTVKNDEDDDETFEPSKILELIFEFAKDENMFVSLPSGTRIFRARFQPKGSDYKTASALGPPPTIHSIQTNRMSPPGVVMFYAADDPKTALTETFGKFGTYAIGEFEILRSIKILDLTSVPKTPSLFADLPDTQRYDPRPSINFLRHVSREISQPIARDDRVHIEYVPTQIVTEYVRTMLRIEGIAVDGIRYKSSRNSTASALVLFADQDNVVLEKAEQKSFYHLSNRWIELVAVKKRKLKKT